MIILERIKCHMEVVQDAYYRYMQPVSSVVTTLLTVSFSCLVHIHSSPAKSPD